LVKQAESDTRKGLNHSRSEADIHNPEESMLEYLQGKKPDLKKDYQKKSLYNFQ
jgi:hypothetical protein